MDQLLRNQRATLEVEFGSDADGTVNVVVVDGAGATIADTAAVKKPSATGVYQYTLPPQQDLDLFTVTWTGTFGGVAESATTHAEVVGNYLFTLGEARAARISGNQTPLADAATYTDQYLSDWRATIGDLFEVRTGRSWIRRWCRVETWGDGTHVLPIGRGEARTSTGVMLHRRRRDVGVAKVLAVTVSGQTVDPASVKIVGDGLHLTDGTWPRPSPSQPLPVAVELEYGPQPTPPEARENGLRMLLANAVKGDISAYAVSLSGENGNERLVQDGGFAFPPKVWEWLSWFRGPGGIA